MKKIIALLTLITLLACASVCLAGENGNALNKAERTVDKLVDSFSQEKTVAYNDIAKGFNPALQEKISAQGLQQLQKQVADKFGRLQEAKMVSFERFDKGDRVVYLAGFSKEKVVRMVFVFDKDTKMTDFAFSPLNIEAGK